MERPYNRIENKKVFDVTALISAHYFPAKLQRHPYWESYDFSQVFLVMSGTGIFTTEDGRQAPISSGMMIYRPAGHASKYEWTSKKVSFALISFVCQSEAMQVFERAPFVLNEEERAILLDVMKTGSRVCEQIDGQSFDPCSSDSVDEENGVRGMRLRDDVPQVVLSFIYASLERFLAMTYCRLLEIPLGDGDNQKAGNYIHEAGTVLAVKKYLADRIEEHVTLEEICNHFWVSQTSLSKLFRREVGSGVIEFFTDLKIEEAKRRIVSSPKTFTDVAEDLGFSSVNYFSRVFKAKTGMTPTEYSKRASKRHASLMVDSEE